MHHQSPRNNYSSENDGVSLALGPPQGFPQAVVLFIVISVVDFLCFSFTFKFGLDSKHPH